jgi:hypothetical protein
VSGIGAEDEGVGLTEARLSLAAALKHLPRLERQALSLRLIGDLKHRATPRLVPDAGLEAVAAGRGWKLTPPNADRCHPRVNRRRPAFPEVCPRPGSSSLPRRPAHRADPRPPDREPPRRVDRLARCGAVGGRLCGLGPHHGRAWCNGGAGRDGGSAASLGPPKYTTVAQHPARSRRSQAEAVASCVGPADRIRSHDR